LPIFDEGSVLLSTAICGDALHPLHRSQQPSGGLRFSEMPCMPFSFFVLILLPVFGIKAKKSDARDVKDAIQGKAGSDLRAHRLFQISFKMKLILERSLELVAPGH
jgi:hypothetical protein